MPNSLNLKLGAILLVLTFAVTAPLLYGGALLVDKEGAEAGGEGAASGEPPPAGGPVSVTLVAQNSRFDKSTIAASPGASVTVTLENRDAGVPHNVAFYTNRSASQPIFKGNLITGPATETVTFNAPSAPGSYFFRCDVHPDTMTGVFRVG